MVVRWPHGFAFAAALLLVTGSPSSVFAGSLDFETGGSAFSAPVKTLKEIRFRRVVKQEYDFSCGSAALATLLTYHYNRPTLEDTALKAMFKEGDQERIRKEGFSMLDMKHYLDSIGLRAEGYKVSLEKIEQVGVPGIVLIKTHGYLHFVVLKGIRGDQILVGDPALGTKLIARSTFADMWNGIFLVIVGDMKQAKNEFNRREDWQVQVAAPIGTALNGADLATMTMLRPGPNSF